MQNELLYKAHTILRIELNLNYFFTINITINLQ